MRRFALAVASYVLLCLIGMIAIVLHGDGPHPRVVALYPPNGDRYWPGGIVQITFSQPMDEGSVERALQVSPGGEGQGAWFGNTLNLQPLGDWKPNVTYHLELTGSVTDDEGRPLHTPVTLWFRVYHVHHLHFCDLHGIRNVCEGTGAARHYLTRSPAPVLQYALSPDGTLLAFIRRDDSGLPHLFLIQVDGTNLRQLTHGRSYADSAPFWSPGDSSDVSYYRRPVLGRSGRRRLGKPQLWNVQTDGTANAPM